MFQMIRHRISVRHIGIWRRVPQGSFSCRAAAIHLLAADNACTAGLYSLLPYELLYDCPRQSLVLGIRCAEHHPLGIVTAEQLDKLELAYGFAPHQRPPLTRGLSPKATGGERILPLSQPIRLTAPLTRGALGAPAPVKQIPICIIVPQ